jgi:hypothetical protein
MFTVVELDIEMADIKRIKLERSAFQVFIHYVYSLLRPFIRYQKKLLDDFVLYDNGMKIGDAFIPYEYMVTVTTDDMVILAKKEDDDAPLVPGDNLMKITFSKPIDPMVVQNNLYYHLKCDVIGTPDFQGVLTCSISTQVQRHQPRRVKVQVGET